MGRSLFTPEAYNENQELGQRSGRIEIQCTLKAKECHWTTTKRAESGDVAETTKLLYFDIKYTDHGKGAVRTASVRVDVGKEVNDAPVPTFRACAPLAGIKGTPVRQHVLDSKTTDPQGELTGMGVGGARQVAASTKLAKRPTTSTDGPSMQAMSPTDTILR
jgi:hypothetical protein